MCQVLNTSRSSSFNRVVIKLSDRLTSRLRRLHRTVYEIVVIWTLRLLKLDMKSSFALNARLSGVPLRAQSNDASRLKVLADCEIRAIVLIVAILLSKFQALTRFEATPNHLLEGSPSGRFACEKQRRFFFYGISDFFLLAPKASWMWPKRDDLTVGFFFWTH